MEFSLPVRQSSPPDINSTAKASCWLAKCPRHGLSADDGCSLQGDQRSDADIEVPRALNIEACEIKRKELCLPRSGRPLLQGG